MLDHLSLETITISETHVAKKKQAWWAKRSFYDERLSPLQDLFGGDGTMADQASRSGINSLRSRVMRSFNCSLRFFRRRNCN